MPVDSTIAGMAHEVSADASGDKAHIVVEELRRAVERPALSQINLLSAIEKATSH